MCILEFLELKSTLYAFVKSGGLGDRKAKRTDKNADKKILHEEYKDVLFGEKCVRH